MIAAERLGGARSVGWLASVGLHLGLAFAALLVTQRLTLAPETATFKWNVTMVAAPSNLLQPSATPATTIQPSHIKPPSQAATTSTSAAITSASVTSSPATLEPLPPSEEPLVKKKDVSSTLQRPLERTVQQPEDLENSPRETSPMTSTLSNQQPESLSESLPTLSSSQPSLQPQESVLPVQTSSMASLMTQGPRPDYTWLSETIMRRMQELKKYPAEARLHRAEGRVVLKAVIRSDGVIGSVEVFQSSGHESLDRAAVELLNLAAPFHLPRPLEKSQMTVKIPMNYRLEP